MIIAMYYLPSLSGLFNCQGHQTEDVTTLSHDSLKTTGPGSS